MFLIFIRNTFSRRTLAACLYYVRVPVYTRAQYRGGVSLICRCRIPRSRGKDCARAVSCASPSGKCVYLFAQPTNAAEILHTRTAAIPGCMDIHIYTYVCSIYFIKYVTSRIFTGLSSPHVAYTYSHYTHKRVHLPTERSKMKVNLD